MDIKAVLAALEAQGVKLAVTDLYPLAKSAMDLALDCAKKNITDLRHKQGLDEQ